MRKYGKKVTAFLMVILMFSLTTLTAFADTSTYTAAGSSTAKFGIDMINGSIDSIYVKTLSYSASSGITVRLLDDMDNELATRGIGLNTAGGPSSYSLGPSYATPLTGTIYIEVLTTGTVSLDEVIVNFTTDPDPNQSFSDFNVTVSNEASDGFDISYAVQDATSYEIYLDDVLQTTTTDTTYTFSGLNSLTTYSVKVVAKADGYNDKPSEITATTTDMDATSFSVVNVSRTDSTIKAYFTTDAESVEVYLDGVLVETLTGVDIGTSYEYTALESETDYTIKFVASSTGNTDYTYEQSFSTNAAVNTAFQLTSIDRTGKVNANDTVTYTFNKEVTDFTDNATSHYGNHTITGNKVAIDLTNPYGSSVTVDFTVTDIDGDTLNVTRTYTTIQEGESFMTWDFGFVTNWQADLLTSLQENAVIIVGAGLVLAGLIIGAFYLIGLAKKAIKNSK